MSVDNGLTRTRADAILKDFYLPGIRSVLNNEVFLLSQMEQNSEDVEGRAAVLSINTGRNAGVGARAELDTLPAAGNQQYAESRVQLKYNYGRIQLSGPVIRSTGSDRGSFARAVQSETAGVVRDLRNDVNRQLYGDGTGNIVNATGVNTAAVVPIAGAGPGRMRQLENGMVVDVINDPLGTPTVTGTATIVGQDKTPAAETITLSTTIVTAAGDYIVRTGSFGVGASQKELTGLFAQVAATGVLWNIDPASYPKWASFENLTAGVAVTEEAFIEASQEVNLNSGEQIDVWITTSKIHRETAELLTSLKRFPTTNEMRGGYSGLDMSDVSQGNTGSHTVTMTYDKDQVHVDTAFGLTMRRFQCYKMSDWEFMQEDGAILHRVPNTDAYEATLFCYMEMATDGRNAHAKVVFAAP